jgi:hypothetical protein
MRKVKSCTCSSQDSRTIHHKIKTNGEFAVIGNALSPQPPSIAVSWCLGDGEERSLSQAEVYLGMSCTASLGWHNPQSNESSDHQRLERGTACVVSLGVE